MFALVLVLACQEEEPRVLVLEGPERVRVDHLGAVDGPEVRLDDGTAPRGVIVSAHPEGVVRVEADAVHAVGPGVATVVAEWEEQTVQWTLEVDLARVLTFVDPPPSVPVGEEVQLQVVAVVGDEPVEVGETVWTSTDPGLLTVTDAGRVLGVAPGTAWVTVVGDGARSMVQIDVTE